MRALKYVVCLWAAILIYSISSIFVGNMGLTAYNELSEKRDLQKKNIALLSDINRQLEGEKDALLFDRDSISVHARNLGYGFEGEQFVRIVGSNEKQNIQISPGTIYRPEEGDYISDKTLRVFAIIVGAALTVFMAILDLLHFIREL